jgi:TRAP-type transport system periplasmic protein
MKPGGRGMVTAASPTGPRLAQKRAIRAFSAPDLGGGSPLPRKTRHRASLGVPGLAGTGSLVRKSAGGYSIAGEAMGQPALCANKQKFQSLPQDVRSAIMSVSGLAGAKFWGRNFFDTAEQGVIERAKAGNYELNRYQVPPDELTRWTKIAGEPIWNEWVKKMEGKGHANAREVLNTTLDLLKN